MKVLVGDLTIAKEKGYGLGTLTVIGGRDPQLVRGYRHICQLLNNSTYQGRNWNHICLVLEAMSLNVYRALLGPKFWVLFNICTSAVLFILLIRSCTVAGCRFSKAFLDIKGNNTSILQTGAPPEEGQLNIELNDDYLMSKTFKLSDLGATWFD